MLEKNTLYCTIQWIVIYPVDRVVHPVRANQGEVYIKILCCLSPHTAVTLSFQKKEPPFCFWLHMVFFLFTLTVQDIITAY